MYYPSICFILITNWAVCARAQIERALYSFANSSMSKWISSSFRYQYDKASIVFLCLIWTDDGVACFCKNVPIRQQWRRIFIFFHSYLLIMMRLIKIKLNQYPSMAIDAQSFAWAHTLNCKWERFIWPTSSGLSQRTADADNRIIWREWMVIEHKRPIIQNEICSIWSISATFSQFTLAKKNRNRRIKTLSIY